MNYKDANKMLDKFYLSHLCAEIAEAGRVVRNVLNKCVSELQSECKTATSLVMSHGSTIEVQLKRIAELERERDGGPVVEKILENRKMRKCIRCGAISDWNKVKCKCGCVIAKHHYLTKADMHWTEREKIETVIEISEQTFEEIK